MPRTELLVEVTANVRAKPKTTSWLLWAGVFLVVAVIMLYSIVDELSKNPPVVQNQNNIQATEVQPTIGQIVQTPASLTQTTVVINPTATEVISYPATSTEEENFVNPADFTRWYFTAVWQDRNYDYLWTLSTPSFQTAAAPGGYNDFTTWWGSVDRARINSITVSENDGHYSTIHVDITYYLHDGRISKNQDDYDLVFDSIRRTWMFDYR